jgi:hypothetical protein
MTPAEEAAQARMELENTEVPQPEVEETEQVKEPEPCVRCGWSPGKENKPLESDLEEYLRCILGGQSFHKEYEMYDGKIKLVFRSINNKQVDALNNLLFKMADHIDQAVIQDKSIKLKLMYFLSEAKLAEQTHEYPMPRITEYDQIDAEFNARFGEFGEPVIRMMSQTLMLFMELQGMLITQGFDSNFWKGAGLR